jgi:outer membrane protein OmpA-like peptidoglycan-associated protein
MRFHIAWLLSCAVLAAPVAAEEARFPVERFRPAIDGTGVLDVDSGQVGEHLQWTVGAFANYALNPLVFVNADGERVGSLVSHRIGLDVIAAISLIDWLEVGVDIPTVLFQTRDSSVSNLLTTPGELSAIGVGDMRLLSKVRLLRARDGQFVDLAIIPAITVPTGFPGGDTGSYLGEGQVTFAPELAVSRDFGEHEPGGAGLRLAANLGYRFRPEERDFVNVKLGHELTARLGAAYRLASSPLMFEASANAATSTFTPFTSGLEENPLEVIVGASYDVMPFLRLTGGVGKGIISGVGTPDVRALFGVRLIPVVDDDRDDDGIKNAADTCPDDPEDKDGFKDDDGCPDVDNDNDGILDTADKCRDVAEDADSFEDADGCPDPDNDKDGILDVDDKCVNEPGVPELQGCPIPPVIDTDKDGLPDDADRCPTAAGPKSTRGCPDTDGDGFVDVDDKCPTEPENINGVEDEDGCPDKGKSAVKLTREKIEILDKVYFDVNKDTIQARSFSLLDQVASVLKAHPELTTVRVEGHTDSDGKDEANLDLSDRRAKAVQRYLVDKGVAAERLQAVGYGETRPVKPNTNKTNKEANRRVEFVIAAIDGVATSTNSVPATTEKVTP